jgi:hypothetical protein
VVLKDLGTEDKMAIDPRTIQSIADPTGGKLGQIGQTLARSRQQAIENQRNEELMVEKKKTGDLQRQIYESQLEKAEVDNLLNQSKILSGVVEQFRTDVQKNPLIIQDPQAYNQYMTMATQGLPEDVVEQFKGITPDQIPQIGRRSARMINALTDVKEKKAPTTRKIGETVDGKSYVVDQEWNPTTDKWDEVGRAPKTPVVTVNSGEKEASKFAFQQFTTAIKDSEAAQKTKDNISYAREALKDIETGALTGVRVNLNRIGASFGFSVQEDIPSIAGANTAFGNMVMAGLNAFPGQISEGERKFLETRMPNIVQTKEGREQIMTLLDRLADRPIEYRKEMNKFMQEHSNNLMPEGKDSFYSKWDEKIGENPLFKGLDMLTETLSEDEYVEVRTLPDGTKMGKKADGSIERIE